MESISLTDLRKGNEKREQFCLLTVRDSVAVIDRAQHKLFPAPWAFQVLPIDWLLLLRWDAESTLRTGHVQRSTELFEVELVRRGIARQTSATIPLQAFSRIGGLLPNAESASPTHLLIAATEACSSLASGMMGAETRTGTASVAFVGNSPRLGILRTLDTGLTPPVSQMLCIVDVCTPRSYTVHSVLR